MINFDNGNETEQGGELSNFIKDTHQFFEEFNSYNPAKFEVKDHIRMSVIFLLSRISNSLKNIENSLMREKENGKF